MKSGPGLADMIGIDTGSIAVSDDCGCCCYCCCYLGRCGRESESGSGYGLFCHWKSLVWLGPGGQMMRRMRTPYVSVSPLFLGRVPQLLSPAEAEIS